MFPRISGTGCLQCVVLLSAAMYCASPKLLQADTSQNASEHELAKRIFDATDVQGGLVVHLGCHSGRLTAALGEVSDCIVQGLSTDAEQVGLARQTVDSSGSYGRVSIAQYDGSRLPYVPDLVNLLIISDPASVDREECLRVLCPGGVAVTLDSEQSTFDMLRKPWPEEIDEWTHWLHGADGNAVADDWVVGPPRHAQWIAEPRWQRHHEASPSFSAMVSAGGRLFAIINEAPAGIDGLPDQWVLVARDAFNGRLLWKRPIPEWGWQQWGDHSYGDGRWNHPTHIARRLVAIGDRVYVTLGFNAPLTALDAATGRAVMTYPDTEYTDEILYRDGTLVLAVNTAPQGPGRIAEKPAVTKEIMAVNAQTGNVLWRTGQFVGIASKADAIERVTHVSMTLGDEHVFLIEDDAVTALDLATGKRRWAVERPTRERPVTYGHYYFTNLCTMIYQDGRLFFSEPDPTITRQPWNAPVKTELSAIAADTGQTLWTRECGMWGHYSQGDLFVIDGLVWIYDHPDFAIVGLDPKTGEVQRTLAAQEALDQGHHHRCYRNKATPRFILTSRRGVEFIDVKSEENHRHHWFRGACRYGIMPCNGLLYVPPHPCVCYITAKLNGFWALAAERKSKDEGVSAKDEERRTKHEAGEERVDQKDRLVRGPAYVVVDKSDSSLSHTPSSLSLNSSSWWTYRGDAARSGGADAPVSNSLEMAWSTHVGHGATSPVVADGRVHLAVTGTHCVLALDADRGTILWRYTAGGPIDTPPTVYRGLALFGCADGWVYCLRAADGQLVWRRRAARGKTQIMNNGQLESPWPVNGAVLVQNGVAYFAAGRSSFLDDGITVCAVDPVTGELLRQRTIDSRDPETGDMVEARLPYDMPPDALGALPDVLVGDGESLYMRHLSFDPGDLQFRSAADTAKKNRREFPYVGGHLMSVAGMLDDSWFNQTYWTVDGKAHSKLLVFDDDAAYGVKPFPGNARHSRAIFRPGTKGYTLFANERPNHKQRWSIQVPIRIGAMVVAGPALFVAGTPDTVDPDDPWSAIEGRAGGVMWAVSTADGKKLAEYHLESPPRFDGMAAADGCLYVSCVDGQVLCYVGKR